MCYICENKCSMRHEDLIKDWEEESDIDAETLKRAYRSLVTVLKRRARDGFDIPLRGLGKIVPVTRKGKLFYNPRTKSMVATATKRSCRFQLSKTFTE